MLTLAIFYAVIDVTSDTFIHSWPEKAIFSSKSCACDP